MKLRPPIVAKYLFALLLLITNATLIAQPIRTDTVFVFSALENTKNVYFQIMKDQNQLYNGGDYVDYRSQNEEHPYFISEDWITGSIQYNHETYENVYLLYNIFTDQVITELPSASIMIQLIRDKVQSFSIAEHQFVMITEKDIPTGFYDQLCNGKTKLFAKRKKEFHETSSVSETKRDFTEKSKYFIFKDDHYYPVKTKKSVLTILGDRKRELNQFIRQNNLHFRKNRETAILKLTEFYNGN